MFKISFHRQMDSLRHGDALWWRLIFWPYGWYLNIQNPTTSREPAPTDYTRIRIGDVGFIRRGQFHLLFSATSPVGDVPSASEPLTIGKTAFRGPRIPGCLRTDTIQEIGAGLGTALPTSLYALLQVVLHLSNNKGVTQAPGTWRTFLIRAHRNSRCGADDEVPDI